MEIEKQKNVRLKSSLEQNLKKLQNFRQIQFETEFEQQVVNLRKNFVKENFKKINKNNRLMQSALPNKYSNFLNKHENIEDDKSFKKMEQKIKNNLLNKFHISSASEARLNLLVSSQTVTVQDFRSADDKLKINERSKTFHDLPPIKKVTFMDNYEDDNDVTEKVNQENNDKVKINLN